MPTLITDQPVPRLGTSAFMMMIIMPAVKAAIEPTERSMPPAVMTKVAPTAMTPMDGGARHDIGDVGIAEEIAVEHGAEDDQQDQRQQRAESAEPEAAAGAAATPVRWLSTSCRSLPLDAHLIAHDLLLGDRVADEFADDAAVPHHHHSVAESDDFLQSRTR